ncbi:PRC-barrel domain containing protein [Cereibacter sediminicola]|uniref:PRC-barrel domain containing protein n=1 Tax=Cereibacter sediminicola TaxID=2584941 RepID=UPI0011A73079|nr:PRC-barrel domain containing protein [Cereibacter sediminicola]
MPKALLTTVAMGLIAAAPAFAQLDTQTDTQGTPPLSDLSGQTPGQTGQGMTDTAPMGQDQIGQDQTDPLMPGQTDQDFAQDDATMGATSGMMQAYDSYSETDDFNGQVAGDRSADELMQASIVNSDGETVGRIVDLAIGEDGNIDQAVVELSDVGLAEEERHVMISLDELSSAEGDATGEFVLDRAGDDLSQMQRFEKSEDRWEPAEQDI